MITASYCGEHVSAAAVRARERIAQRQDAVEDQPPAKYFATLCIARPATITTNGATRTPEMPMRSPFDEGESAAELGSAQFALLRR
jgi:hypothetical protein